MYLDTYPVESGIPIPPRIGKYDWGRLNVGDSLFIPGEGKGRRPLRDTVRNCSRSYAKRHGVQFRVKASATGVRVWRIL